MKNKREKIKVGTALIKQLSSSFYPKNYMIFDELVSNSRDALATQVRLKIYDDYIEIEDNGEGMTAEELVRFFYISSTHKSQNTERSFKGIKRQIIGKFGIGKLSLYQMCKKFKIETWRDGMMSRSEFDFTEFEKNDFIDDFHLDVTTEETDRIDSGTKITLLELKDDKHVDVKEIRRNLQLNMPLSPDFKIFLEGTDFTNPIELSATLSIQGHKHEIRADVPGVGLVKGFILYKGSDVGDYGVYIRVKGRLVRPPSPETDIHPEGGERLGGSSHINLASLTHAQQFVRRIYADFNVDSLDEALQTNRAGFIADNPKYKNFIKWLKTTLNRYNGLEYQVWQREKDKIISQSMPERMSDEIRDSIGEHDIVIQSHSKPLRINESKAKNKEIKFNSKLIVKSLGEDASEASFDEKKNTVFINSDHPVFKIAKARGRIWGIRYHMFKSAIIAIAAKKAYSIEEFLSIYDQLSKRGKKAIDIRK